MLLMDALSGLFESSKVINASTHSLTRPYRRERKANTSYPRRRMRGTRRERKRGGRKREGRREREPRDTGLESVPVGITRTERSQERARDPRQKTINTDFANSYTPPGNDVSPLYNSHTSFADETDGDGERRPATPLRTCA